MTDPKLERAIESFERDAKEGVSPILNPDESQQMANWLRRLQLAELLLSRIVNDEGLVCVEVGTCPGCVHYVTMEGYRTKGCDYIEWCKLKEESNDGE